MNASANVYDVSKDTFQQDVIEKSFQVPVVVDFWAEWCGPCRMLMPLLSQVVESYNGEVALAKVNSDSEQELAAQYGVRSLPTVKVFKNGQPVDEFMGALPEGQIREFLARHVVTEADRIRQQAIAVFNAGEPEQALELLKQANQQAPDNQAVVLDIARIKAGLGDMDEALDIAKALPEDLEGVKELKAQIQFSQQAEGVDPEELQARIEADPADLEARQKLASMLIIQQDFEGAMDQFLEIMKRDRGFGDDAGRRGLLDTFEMLGSEHPLVKTYRGRMFSLLY